MTRAWWMGTLLAATLVVGACGDKGDPVTDDTAVSDDTGGTGGDDTSTTDECNTDNEGCPDEGSCSGEGSNMLPGADCLACHTQGNMPKEDEPDKWYTVGGTVFTDVFGTDGESGATVIVTDSEGTEVTLTSSSAGNFYSRTALVPPLSAEVHVGGEIKQMASTVSTGACNSCHKCDGAAGGKLHP